VQSTCSHEPRTVLSCRKKDGAVAEVMEVLRADGIPGLRRVTNFAILVDMGRDPASLRRSAIGLYSDRFRGHHRARIPRARARPAGGEANRPSRRRRLSH
jgi:hypothetical protein